MDRINKIIKHELYLEFVERIKVHEKDRIFCKHDPVHFLDVCRLSEIEWLENKINVMECGEGPKGEKKRTIMEFEKIDRELLYACGLLHDIGRWQEYETGIRHEIASAE